MADRFVLLVEDNADDEALTLRAFKKSRIKNEVVIVRDGEEAIEFIFGTGRYSTRNVNELPEVVLLDLKIPKLNGHQVLERIRSNPRTKTLPVIILTSSKEEKDLEQSYAIGANSYIVKPVDTTQFLDSIQQLGLYWLVLNQSAVS